jgi:hypothetical protein
MKILKPRLTLVLLSALYSMILNWTYIYFISPDFEYLGYVYEPPSGSLLVFLAILAVSPSLWMPIALQRPSQLIYWILYLAVLIPSCFIVSYTLPLQPEKIVLLNICLFSAFALLGYLYKIPRINVALNQVKRINTWLLIISLFIYTLLVSKYGFSIRGLSLSQEELLDVYDIRADYGESISSGFLGKLIAYVLVWQANAINPFFVAHGILFRNIAILSIGLVGQLFIFSITGFKAVWFYSVVIFIFSILIRKKRHFGIYLILSFCSLILLFLAFDQFLFHELTLTSLTRRVLITPSLLTGFYYEFFSVNPHIFLAHSIFKSFIDYPYDLNPPHLIGYYYFNNEGTSANANIWADGFANFGLLGIYLSTLILGFVLWLIDSLSLEQNIDVVTLMLIVPALTLTDSAVLTSLLNHGILISILMIYSGCAIDKREKCRRLEMENFT